MKTRTDALYEAFSAAFEPLFGTPCPDSLLEASEGDARKYMKKAIENSGLVQKVIRIYGDNWSELAFNRIRSLFVHHDCDVYFVPGIARIAYGELNLDGFSENERGLSRLRELVSFISNAHREEFTRNLEHITIVQQGPQKGMKVRSAPMSLRELSDLFMQEQEDTTDSQRKAFVGNPRGTRYKVIELNDFDMAKRFLKFTDPESPWCYLQSRSTFEHYRENGNRLYLALAPGYTKLTPGDPGYGRSMIGFDMGPVGKDGTSKLCACSNRYNHADNKEAIVDKSTGKLIDPDTGMPPKKGDAAYNEVQLSKILGVPVWSTYLGFDPNDIVKSGKFDEQTLSKIWDTKEDVLAAISDPNGLMERLGLEVKKVNPGVYLFKSGGAGENGKPKTCYVVLDGPNRVPYWGYSLQYLPGGRALIMGSMGRIVIDDKGMPLNNDIYDSIKLSRSSGFPIAVGKGNPNTEGGGYDSRQIMWNYIDENGDYLSEDWFNYADSFDQYGFARVGMVNLYERSLENPYTFSKLLNIIDSKGDLLFNKPLSWISSDYDDIITGRGRYHFVKTVDGNIFITDHRYVPLHSVPLAEIYKLERENGTECGSLRLVQDADSKKYSVFNVDTHQFLTGWYTEMSHYIHSFPGVNETIEVYNEQDQSNFVELGKGLLSDVWFSKMLPLDMHRAEPQYFETGPIYYVMVNGRANAFNPALGLLIKQPVDAICMKTYRPKEGERYVVTKTGDRISLVNMYGESHDVSEQEFNKLNNFMCRNFGKNWFAIGWCGYSR